MCFSFSEQLENIIFLLFFIPIKCVTLKLSKFQHHWVPRSLTGPWTVGRLPPTSSKQQRLDAIDDVLTMDVLRKKTLLQMEEKSFKLSCRRFCREKRVTPSDSCRETLKRFGLKGLTII